jgi:hypothetical protein
MGQHGERKRALGTSATFFARKMEQRSSTVEHTLDTFSVKLIGQLPAFFNGMVELATDHGTQRWNRRKALEQVVPFNHTLRDMVDYFPDLKIDDVKRFCTVAALDILGGNDTAIFEQMVFDTLVGMQQEIALEQVLMTIPDVQEVRKAESVDEEHRGIDVIALYRGVEIPLDAKSSKIGVQKALIEKQPVAKGFGNIDARSGYPVYTGIGFEEFKSKFRAPETAVERSVPHVLEVLESRYDILTQEAQHTA